jgi:FAD/FMN-containing dehydrogenase
VILEIKARLAKIVGGENVVDDPEELRSFSADQSLEEPRMPSYAIRPKDSQDIQEVIQLANEIKVPVVPSSSGIHFNGSALPVQGCIVLDLRRMNRILEIDEKNRKVRIEPGVTWPQLQAELAKKHLMAMMPLLPHSLKSVVTSHLEREPIVIAKHEYADPMLTMEFVYPTGKIMRTGSAVVPGATTTAVSDGVFPEGPGIDHWRLLQGAQGTMGVVTWANVKVEHLPAVSKVFFILFDRIEDAIEPLYKIQRRMIGLECFLLNNLNLASIMAEKLPNDIEALVETLPEWILVLVLSGGPRHPEMKIEYEEEALGEIREEFSLNKIMTTLPGIPEIERKLLGMLRSGLPKDKIYWKFACRGSCQDIFFLTTLEKAPSFLGALREILATYRGVDVGLYVQPIEYGRACHFECNIYYSSSDPRQVEAVRSLYVEAAELLLNLGALFTRPYGALADLVYARTTSYTATLKKLKGLYDPHNILAPGRLCFK